MENIFKSKLFIFIILALSITYLSSYHVKSYLKDSKTFYTEQNPITHEQSKAQVGLFRNVLDKFGASSPEEVIQKKQNNYRN